MAAEVGHFKFNFRQPQGAQSQQKLNGDSEYIMSHRIYHVTPLHININGLWHFMLAASRAIHEPILLTPSF